MKKCIITVAFMFLLGGFATAQVKSSKAPPKKETTKPVQKNREAKADTLTANKTNKKDTLPFLKIPMPPVQAIDSIPPKGKNDN